jgi:hypothetical protein
VYLRAYGQKDPLVEFKSEAYEMFEVLMQAIRSEILHNLFRSASNLMAFEQFLASLPQFLQSSDETGEVVETREPAGPAYPELPEASLDSVFGARARELGLRAKPPCHLLRRTALHPRSRRCAHPLPCTWCSAPARPCAHAARRAAVPRALDKGFR